MTSTEAHRQALKDRVCGICLDRRDDGTCGLPASRTCAIDLHFPKIVQAVEAVESNRISDYAASIQTTVCGQCPNQNVAGYCHFRENFECALDAFVYLVVDAIEDVKQRRALAGVKVH